MKFKKYKSEFEKFRATIEEDLPDIGWQLYVFHDEIDIYDNVQDTLKICQEEAFEEFGIPLDSWVEVEEELIRVGK
jgi:hypothetical protein